MSQTNNSIRRDSGNWVGKFIPNKAKTDCCIIKSIHRRHMITSYHRPKTLEEALTLLTQPNRIPLGGGTLLSKPTMDPVEVVDLQALSLDWIKKNGNNLEIGATVTLQQLLESEECPESWKQALKLEAPLNIRNAASVAGTLVACDGRSTFATACLALDARLEMKSMDKFQLVEI